MPLNRELQRELLSRMSEVYPRGVFFNDLPGEVPEKILNLLYLADHGLCDSGLIPSLGGNYTASESIITARGLDFLEDDGGLSAVLGTVTVKLHGDTIRELLASKIEALDLPAAEKKSLRSQLATLPATALQGATLYLVQAGLSHLPDAAAWLQSLVASR